MNILRYLLVAILPVFFLAKPAFAHCPLCVAGAGIGLSLANSLGIDDSITGVWIGAFLGAVSFWTEVFLSKKKIKNVLMRPLLYLVIFISTIWSFYAFGLVNKHFGTIFGLDKLTFGIISGGAVFYLADFVDGWVIKRVGRVFIPYQRIYVSLGSMLVLSILIYILINYYI
ncbi:hypothetical protein HYV21_00075 [Candidatus Microgenomates bacterium]|nr:hypothetical protein [Candidatus Microgenomates bacterium]